MEIMLICLGAGFFLVCLALTHKIFSETKIKKMSFKKSPGEHHKHQTHHHGGHDHTAEDLMKKLDEFRNARFSRNMTNLSKRSSQE